MKAFTDLKQSKKLTEILSLESADMIWVLANPDLPMIKSIAYKDSEKSKYYEILPAWSLAALLEVLPYPFLSELSNEIWKCGCYSSGICYYVTADSAIDACVEMIIKLNELKML